MSRKYNSLNAYLKGSPELSFTHCYANAVFEFGNGCFFLSISESYKRTPVWYEMLAGMTEGREKLWRLQKIGKTHWWAKDHAFN